MTIKYCTHVVLIAFACCAGSIPAQQVKEASTTAPSVPSLASLETTWATHHEWKKGSVTIPYTATVGRIAILDAAGKPYHVMSYVAYTADSPDAKQRPITFFYNGGPGAASLSLHIGSFAPIRVLTKSPESTPPPPYKVVPNEYSLLDRTDMVFIDAPGVGLSHIVGSGSNKDVFGADEDVRAFDLFVRRYITKNLRWNSPKFLFGESYGTTRSSMLVASLALHGVDCNGVILLSSLLNYNTNGPGLDEPYINLLPTLAATAYYHHKAGTNEKSIEAFVEKARQFANGPYLLALAKGNTLTGEERDKTAAQLSSFTGLSATYVKNADLRINAGRFRRELLRDQGIVLGAYDGRFEGAESDRAGENPSGDPTDDAMHGVYTGAFEHYLLTDLAYTGPEYYSTGDRTISGMWNSKHRAILNGAGREQAQPNALGDLADSMRRNPDLKVFSANGYFDMATPFFGTEESLAHMGEGIAPQRVTYGYYPSGHMVYLNVEALKKFRGDLEAFYTAALR